MTTDTLSDRKILVVTDDEASTRELVSVLRGEGYDEVEGSDDPREALYRCARWGPDLLVLDLDLEDTDALAIVRKLKGGDGTDPPPEVVGLTDRGDRDDLDAFLDAGVDALVREPVSPAELVLDVRSRLMLRTLTSRDADADRARDAEADQARQAAAEADRDLERAQIGVLQTLARLVEYRDFKTERHSERVGELSARIAREMGLPDEDVALLRDAAPLHDVGMVVVPDHILLKEGRLDDDERKIMMTHAANGARILSESELPVMQLASTIAHTHHERWDGEGYPRGLEGEEIPLPGRIVAAADTFEAITHDRPFREAESAEEALEEIRRERGKQFDPEVVDALLAVKEDEPDPIR
ncbi:MAG: HD domain-containing phosphohydrolase [Gemmatimonadota bacterium]